jgi:hypothetical protein
VVQELLEGEQADFLDGRGRYERRAASQRGSRNGYERGRIRTANGPLDVRVPQVRDAGESFRSGLMSFLDGNSEVLDRLVTEMYARGLSTRAVGLPLGRNQIRDRLSGDPDPRNGRWPSTASRSATASGCAPRTWPSASKKNAGGPRSAPG